MKKILICLLAFLFTNCASTSNLGNNALKPIIDPPDKEWMESKQLTLENITAAIKYHKLDITDDIGKIILAQYVLETGWGTSVVSRTHNNLFGLCHTDGYFKFNKWQDSVLAYKTKVQYKYKDPKMDYYSWLDDIGYAEAPNYTAVLRQIVPKISDMYDKVDTKEVLRYSI